MRQFNVRQRKGESKQAFERRIVASMNEATDELWMVAESHVDEIQAASDRLMERMYAGQLSPEEQMVVLATNITLAEIRLRMARRMTDNLGGG